MIADIMLSMVSSTFMLALALVSLKLIWSKAEVHYDPLRILRQSRI